MGRRRGDSLASSAAFRILACLLAAALLASGLIYRRLEALSADLGIHHHQHDVSPLPHPHLHPRLPHLPPFPAIDNEDALINQTIYEPTVAGVAAILYRHLRALHASNRRLAIKFSSQPKRGGPKQREAEAGELRAAYFRLVDENLREFEEAYRGRNIFPVREDDSIFVSVASFREHLLAETLMSAFGRAARPEKLFVGVVVNNCFGTDTEFPCKGTAEVVGQDANGLDLLQSVDGKLDANGIEAFCGNVTFQQYCDAGQVRVLYVHEVDALGPAVARYYASKLWGGETFVMQVDSHLRFASRWDELLVEDVKLASSYPRAVLSTYPPGFVNLQADPPYMPGTRLCRCQMRVDEDFLPRVEMLGHSPENETRPSQTPFMAAGFFFARAEFLKDVPFDPYLPWLFMGEEAALSIRAYTSGWNMYAPRKSLVGHQYRPLKMGNPHFTDIWGKFFHRPQLMDRLSPTIHDRIKTMMGYPEFEDGAENYRAPSNYSLVELSCYGVGTRRSRDEYLQFAKIDLKKRTCGGLKWCAEGSLQ
ncbi:hypothetical protein ACHAXT_005988 [Thalassiosira profunda]